MIADSQLIARPLVYQHVQTKVQFHWQKNLHVLQKTLILDVPGKWIWLKLHFNFNTSLLQYIFLCIWLFSTNNAFWLSQYLLLLLQRHFHLISCGKYIMCNSLAPHMLWSRADLWGKTRLMAFRWNSAPLHLPRPIAASLTGINIRYVWQHNFFWLCWF